MAGMGIFPDPENLRLPTQREKQYSIAEIDNLLMRSTANFREQREVLQAIPPRRDEESLQIYFW
jgi:hypothetical protein